MAVDRFVSAATISVMMQESEDFTVHRPSEEELVRVVLAGDKAAYGTLYDRFAPLIRAICHDYAHNLTDAQDLAQDVFLRAYQRLDELRKPESFGPWIVGIARRRCSEWCRQKLRERRRHAACRTQPQVFEDAGPTGENGQLLRLVATLSEDERLALHAFYLQDKSVEEARRIVGLSRSGFYKVLKQALVHLKHSVVQESEGA